MAMSINTNVLSLNAQRNLSASASQLAMSLERLSSGLRINSAKDDAAGLAIADRFTTQIRGLTQAARNANDGISLSQTAEGALASVTNNLQRMRELAVQSANSTNSTSDRAALQNEVSQLAAEIDRVATQTQFNGLSLLDGSFQAQQFQVGANAGQTITVSSISNARASALGQFQGYTLTNQSIGTASNTTTATTVNVGGTGNVSLGTIATDAKALAAAINASGVGGLTATANATSVAAGTSATAGTVNGSAVLTLNGVAISIAGTTTSLSGNRTAAVTAINAQSAVTGVSATDTGAGVSLAAADGRNITTSYAATGFTNSLLADFGLGAAATTGASVNINYAAPAGITGNVVFAGAFANTTAIAATGTAVSAINISTVGGANAALSAIDAALTSVSSSRAALGATQSRFESTISNLQVTTENLSAARGRILDTDFAAETANLTKAQILQQAGTAMLAQANASPQNVLSLLK
ncbi:MAG: flagellin [Pseudomonadota bacterium]